MSDLVSIFSPVYNIESRYPGALERFLDSVRNQTYANIEVILVDDGSTDNSADVCDKWAQMDGRFHVVRHDRNKTINKARETGFRSCTGQLVFNADPDDLLHPQAIEVQHSLLVEHPDCQAVFGLGPISAVSQAKEINFAPIDHPNYEVADQITTLKDLLRNGTQSFWNKLFRRELLETIDWDVTRFNDFHLMLQISLNGSKFVHLKDTTYYWIQRELSETHTNRVECSIQKFETLSMDWKRYIHNKRPDLYADFLCRAYSTATEGFHSISGEDEKAWREKLRELYKLTWNDYISCDAPLHEKAVFWWLMHFPQHKPVFKKLKSLI